MLKVENLDVYYGEAQAIWGLNLRVESGTICTLVGANGGGKTTFMKTLCGLLSVPRGSIFFDGENLLAVKAEDRVSMGLSMCPEGRKIFANMTVEENLIIGAYHKKAWEKKDEQLEKTFERFPRLKERCKQMGGTLSGGERQMLAIGRALMSEPKMLLLDEPSLGLAPKAVDHVMELIQSINETGMTILLVEQNANVALRIAQYGYVIESGRIAMHDVAESLMSNDHVREAYLGL
jgi:branched-chain amino acid transport system ATP-binding protein